MPSVLKGYLAVIVGAITVLLLTAHPSAGGVTSEEVAYNAFNSGVRLFNAGRTQESCQKFKEALAAKADYAEAEMGFASALKDLGQKQEAISHAQKAVILNPALLRAQILVGLLLLETGKQQEAVDHLKIAINLGPNDPDAILNLAACYSATGQFDLALKYYKELSLKYPHHPAISDIRAFIRDLEQQLKTQSANAVTGPDYFAEVQRNEPARWAHERMPLRVFIHPGNGIPFFQDNYVDLLKQSFLDWQNASGGNLKFVFVDFEKQADINCYWIGEKLQRDTLDAGGIARPGIVNGQIVSGLIKLTTFDRDGLKTFPRTPVQMKSISLHEIGHTLGIFGHSQNPMDAMYYTDTYPVSMPVPSSRDATTLIRLYSELGNK